MASLVEPATGLSPETVDSGEIGAGCSYGNAGLIVPSHSIPLAAPGVFWKGLKWMFDPESPFYIKPRFDGDLFRWLWRFRAACRDGPMKRAVPILRDLHRASARLFDALVADEAIDCSYAKRGVLYVYRTGDGYEEGLAACSKTLLTESESGTALADALLQLLSASEASGVYLYENFEDPEEGLSMRPVLEISAPGLESAVGPPASLTSFLTSGSDSPVR